MPGAKKRPEENQKQKLPAQLLRYFHSHNSGDDTTSDGCHAKRMEMLRRGSHYHCG